MIPLVRPSVPPVKKLEPLLRASEISGQWTNFGPCWYRAVKMLNEATGRYCLPVSNGTTAIQLALMSRFPRGARIAVPDYTHVGTLQAVIQAGMVPIIFPCQVESWTIDRLELIKHKDQFDGVVVVSPFGYFVDFSLYDEFSRVFKKPLIYDLAGAWGMPLYETDAICTFSLHATKNFSCGEGGVICFDSQEQWESARAMSNFCTESDRSISSPYAGNFKIDEFKAAQIVWHLSNDHLIEKKIDRKRSAIDFYQEFLSQYLDCHTLHSHPYAAPSLCVVAGLPIDDIEKKTQSLGFVTRRYYLPLSLMPGLSSVRRAGNSNTDFFRTCCALPSDCTDHELDYVVKAIQSII